MQQQSSLPERKQGGPNPNRPFRHIFRVLSFSCVLLVVLGILAACGSTPGTTGSNSSNKIVITEMDYWSIASQGATLNKLFSQYEQLHPNITIQRDAVPFADLLPKADQEAASHTLPNLLALDNPSVANFAATGALTPLDSFMQGSYSASDFYAGPRHQIRLPEDAPLEKHFDPALLGGMTLIKSQGFALETADWSEVLYRTTRPAYRPYTLTAIPYYAWDHREPGEMRVWIGV